MITIIVMLCVFLLGVIIDYYYNATKWQKENSSLNDEILKLKKLSYQQAVDLHSLTNDIINLAIKSGCYIEGDIQASISKLKEEADIVNRMILKSQLEENGNK